MSLPDDASLNALRLVDAVLEWDVLEAIQMAVRVPDVDTISDVIQALSSGYHGLPHLANIGVQWLRDVDPELEARLKDKVVDTMCQIALQRFNPEKADSLFTVHTQGAPTWLKFIIQDPKWYETLLRLKRMYPACLFLDFAIEEAKQSVGFDKLESRFDRTPASFLEYVSSALCNALGSNSNAAALCATSDIREKMSECATLVLLGSLVPLEATSPTPGQGLLITGLIERMLTQTTFATMYTKIKGVPSESVMQSKVINPVMASGRFLEADLSYLDSLLASKDKFPQSLVLHPFLLKVLIHTLFFQYSSMKQAPRAQLIRIVSSSVCLAPQIEDDLRIVASITSERNVVLVLEKTYTDIVKRLHIPVIGYGVLQWIESHLKSEAFFASAHHTTTLPIFLHMICCTASHHVLLREDVSQVLFGAFHHANVLNGIQRMNCQTRLLQAMIHCAHLGQFQAIFEWIIAQSGSLDHAHVRFFILSLSNSISRPFSNRFEECLRSLLQFHNVQLVMGQEMNGINEALQL